MKKVYLILLVLILLSGSVGYAEGINSGFFYESKKDPSAPGRALPGRELSDRETIEVDNDQSNSDELFWDQWNKKHDKLHEEINDYYNTVNDLHDNFWLSYDKKLQIIEGDYNRSGDVDKYFNDLDEAYQDHINFFAMLDQLDYEFWSDWDVKYNKLTEEINKYYSNGYYEDVLEVEAVENQDDSIYYLTAFQNESPLLEGDIDIVVSVVPTPSADDIMLPCLTFPGSEIDCSWLSLF